MKRCLTEIKHVLAASVRLRCNTDMMLLADTEYENYVKGFRHSMSWETFHVIKFRSFKIFLQMFH